MTSHPDWAGLKHFRFGDSPELADRLAALVVAGVKTATCSAAVHGFEAEIGEQQVVLSGEGRPVAVIETLSLDVIALETVTPAQAAQEGEGDLSHAYWLDVHKAYFQREGTYAPGMKVIFETFRLVAVLDGVFAARANEHLKAERAEALAARYTALGANA
ncbi:ASCH domain-containing protein [Hyphomonas sp.]|uniref:ASCH domain-containing protein n=1 Tax=Hyphomonas sp. TaxID=87 RepID=UPI0025B8C502|nr:ASCH domain-containing protein [Hyphomonas sp.]